jgi:alpha-L-fucosidase
MLRGIGGWLAVNGEAIYGTRPFTVHGEGPTAVVEGPFADEKRKPFTAEDVRFTTRDGKVYAIVLAPPADGRVTIRSLAAGSAHLSRKVQGVDLLGSSDAVKWSQDASGLRIEMPGKPSSPFALALRISLR